MLQLDCNRVTALPVEPNSPVTSATSFRLLALDSLRRRLFEGLSLRHDLLYLSPVALAQA